MFGLILVTSILAVLPFCLSQYGNCDYKQKITTDQTYYVYNPNYPDNYAPGAKCRWRVETDAGFRIGLNCAINIPASQGCVGDKLSIYLTGDESSSDVDNYCGTGNFALSSTATDMLIVFNSTKGSDGGRFLCEIKRENTPCDCGQKKVVRIVGGTTTGINEYPMMAGLVDSITKMIYCGATIISRRHAVTAAHCLVSRDVSEISLVVGEHDTTTGKETNATRVMRLASVKIHDSFDEQTHQNDIAIVETKDMIHYSESVGPACLPLKYVGSDFSGTEVTALGYGLTEFGGAQSNTLQKVSVDALSPSKCRQSYPGYKRAIQLCTYAPNKGGCQFDAGGPLLWLEGIGQREFLVGIISSDNSCGSTEPAINTRITAFLDWITANTPGVRYCYK